jgi:hypothetical protein
MKINDIAEKSYCISLERRPDRWETVKKEFDSNEIFVERFFATDGQLLENTSQFFYKGEAGALDSHRRVLKDAIDNDLDCVAIFEDDVMFVDNFNEKFENYYSEIPSDWETIGLGYNKPSGHWNKISNNVSRLRNVYCAHAFLIKRNAIEYSYNLMLNNTLQADVYYGMSQEVFPTYGLFNALAVQRAGYSDILENEIDYGDIYK